MECESNLFSDTRKQAFYRWKAGTNRNCRGVNDDITESFECKWQDRATDELGYEHISIFCSLGEWASNISDILKDDSCDYCDFLNDEHRRALFRYYTRLLLVVSEILCDFEEIVQKIESPQPKKAREFLSDGGGEVDSLLGFVNNVCKHKVPKLHRCNHHLPIWFEDCLQGDTFTRPISIGNLKFDEADGILVPRLSYFIDVILQCYTHLDALFEQETDKFKMICNEYNGVYYLA